MLRKPMKYSHIIEIFLSKISEANSLRYKLGFVRSENTRCTQDAFSFYSSAEQDSLSPEALPVNSH